MYTYKDAQRKIKEKLNRKIFRTVGETAAEIGRACYAVGGCVRDFLLERKSKDIDFVTVGNGIELAEALVAKLGPKYHLAVFRNFGTAQVKHRDTELEFVGARKESYRSDSRKPIVEDGTLEEDLSRRDFTINAMAVCVNPDNFGELVDNFHGLDDLNNGIIRTPLDPDITFSDDPLRMMRAIRFATQLDFEIEPATFEAIRRNASRIKIISGERIVDELGKMIKSAFPSKGFRLLDESGLLKIIFPEMVALKGVEKVNGRGHKDNFKHTLEVLDNVSQWSDNVWLRWSAVFHDIAKPSTKRWDDAAGWTFHNHNFVGSKMIPKIFRRMKFPMNEPMKYVQKMVELHMRPIALVEDEVTDSAVRRLIHDAGDDIDDLMLLCRADITSKNEEKVKRHIRNFEHVKEKIAEVESRDHVRNFQPPIDGDEIMKMFCLKPSKEVGMLKASIKDAILDGVIPNERDSAMSFLLDKAKEMGLIRVI
ncbi:MAG: HD domain-containing protein [Paramuribaculum sp.]|nr:HD domain-containing protein [Paramuribaculum sp.]